MAVKKKIIKKKTSKKKSKKKILKKGSEKTATGTRFTAKKKRFGDEYLIDLNATQAAIRAGYSKKTAHSQGPRLLEDVEVAAYIAKCKEERSKRTEIDADWLLKRLADEADADVADLYNDAGGLKPVHEWPEIWRKGLVAGLDTHQEYIYDQGERIPDGYVMKVRLSDRIRRLELIGKHVDVQAFKDKVEHSGKVSVIVASDESEL